MAKSGKFELEAAAKGGVWLEKRLVDMPEANGQAIGFAELPSLESASVFYKIILFKTILTPRRVCGMEDKHASCFLIQKYPYDADNERPEGDKNRYYADRY
jgi:hypothetical protein